MKYALLIYEDPDASTTAPADEVEKVYAAYGSFTQELTQAGMLVSGEGLQPTSTATTIRMDGGRPVVTDGPFAETKEWLAGFYVVECPDLDKAIELAARVPSAPWGSVEVRPVASSPSA